MADQEVGTQMANAFKDLNAAFGVDSEESTLTVREPRELIVQPIITDTVANQEKENDLAVVRETLHRVLTKSEDALDDIMHLARQSEHPRAFEVTGQLIKTVSEVAGQLVDLHKKAKELNQTGNGREDRLNGANIGTQNNIMFNGTAEELLDLLQERREKVIEQDMKEVTDV